MDTDNESISQDSSDNKKEESINNKRILSEDMNYYEILEISKNATLEEIKSAFRQKAMEYHPDKNVNDPLATASFILIKKAYDTLSDPDKRNLYNIKLNVISNSQSTWEPSINITFSMSYYGYEIPLDVMNKAEKLSQETSQRTGVPFSEIFSHLLLDPVIKETKIQLVNNPNNVDLLIKLADLYFHTYNSYESLKHYRKALDVSFTPMTAIKCDHLERVFAYSEDYLGGISLFTRFLTEFKSVDELTKGFWRDYTLKLMGYYQDKMLQEIPKDSHLQFMEEILGKRKQYGYIPRYTDYRDMAKTALALKDKDKARTYLEKAEQTYIEPFYYSAYMRLWLRVPDYNKAIQIGEKILPKELLAKTLTPDQQKYAKALAESYEKAKRYEDAIVIYKKLARYKAGGENAKEKAQKLEELIALSNSLSSKETKLSKLQK